jgi:hypothetical protein
MAVKVVVTFWQELSELGVVIPPNTNLISIDLPKCDSLVRIWFRYRVEDTYTEVWSKQYVLKDDRPVTSREFYDMAKESMALPDECISVSILAEGNCITIIKTEAALPEGSLSFLKGCTFSA